MQLSYAALALAALSLQSTLAQPAHHKHHHQHKRAKEQAAKSYEYDLDFTNPDLYKDVDWSKVHYTQGATPVASPHETATPEPVPSGKEDGKPTGDEKKGKGPSKGEGKESAGKGSEDKYVWEGFGGRTTPVDDGMYDHYKGNVGVPYGSNMKYIDESEKGNYKYTMKVTNIHDSDTTYIIWNKSGKDGRPQSGMSSEPNMKFTLGSHESKVIAFDENTQMAMSRDCPRNKMQGNLPDCTWAEANFGDQRTGGWSGYDCSSIPNTRGNVDHCVMSCEGAKTSSHKGNLWTDPSQSNAGGDLAPGPVHIYTEL